MTSMGMRQYGGDSELVVEQPSTEDLSASPNCGSNINLLEAGSSSLHYSNPVSCNFQPATSGTAGSQFSHQQSANTHFQPHIPHQSMQDQFSAETRFNGTPQLSPGKIKKQLSYWILIHSISRGSSRIFTPLKLLKLQAHGRRQILLLHNAWLDKSADLYII